MKATKLLACLLVFATVIFWSSVIVGQNKNHSASKSVSIVGTYKFIYRKLPNGNEVRPPKVMAMLTYTKDYRNFTMTTIEANGKHLLHSIVSKYKLTDKKYLSTLIFSAIFDESKIESKDGGFSIITNQTDSAAVTIKDGKIIFADPFSPVTLTFYKNKFTADFKGVFTDYWEKVR